MRKHLSIYSFLSLLSAPSNLFKKKDKRSPQFDVRQEVSDEAYKNFDNQTGRWDSITTIPSRVLYNVHPDDESELKSTGAIKKDGQWVVPDHVSLDGFEGWGKPVPMDLVDTAPRMTRTKDGKVIEGYKLIEDELKGGDSTAMPIMYGAMAVISALFYLFGLQGDGGMMKVIGLTIFPLLAIPYIWTIAQSEGVKEAIRAVFVTMVLPLAAMMFLLGKMPNDLQGVINVFNGFTWSMLIVPALLFFPIPFILGDTTTGGPWEAFKKGCLWMFLIICGMAVLAGLWLFFPALRHILPAAVWVIPCMYGMIYSEREFITRTERLVNYGKLFNIATQGQLANAHVEARKRQAEDAARDTTPFIKMGTATGYMTDKEYPYAPDRGGDMGQTWLDMTMHTINFGATGRGKTASKMRPLAAAMYKLSQEGHPVGIYIDCGKGALGGDLSGITDITVKTGVPFAYYQGLDAEGAKMALNTKTLKNAQRDGKDQIWVNGAKMLMDHILEIQWALVHHEKAQMKLAGEKMHHFFKVQTLVEAQLLKAKSDAEKMMLGLQLAQCQKNYKEWEEIATSERQWLWNVECTERLRGHINLPRKIDGEWAAGKKMTEILMYLGYKASPKRQRSEPRTIYPTIGRGSILDDSIDYAMKHWPDTDEAQRSSFMINAKDILFPLMRGPLLVDQNGTRWCKLEEGVCPEMCLFGKITAVALPVGQFGETGLLVSALVKQRIYKGVRRRLSMDEMDWRAEGQTPLVLLWDEVQSLVSEDDINLLPQARSAWVMAYFATQGFDSLVNAFGSQQAAVLFCNTFQSLDCMKTSQETYDYLSKRFGTSLMTVFQEQTRGIDYAGSISKYLNSPFNDANHPNKAAIGKIEKHGGARFNIPIKRIQSQMSGFFNPWMDKEERLNEQEVSLGFTANIGGNKEIQPLFKPEEFSALLEGKGVSIAYYQRAGAPRVDVMEFGHLSANDLREIKEQQQGEAA